MTELAKLSLDELLSLQHRAAAEVETRQSAEKDKAKQEILAIASKYGIEVKFGGGTATAAPKSVKAKRGTVAAKYRHPQNSALTWTGRGRSPLWVSEWKTAHGSLDGIVIK
ncbi:MAG: H-NS histone family protein [Stagnimonas sp.]|nr:H-NS histone family protein [Stagnimonas sp.]